MIDATALAETIEWLHDGCPGTPLPGEAVTALCTRLDGCGLPLIYGAIFVRTLHPEVMGQRLVWHRATGLAISNVGYDLFDDAEYRASPVKFVFDEGKPLRRRLCDPDCPLDFSFLDRFRNEGATDFLALPLIASDGATHAAAWMSGAEDGFSDADVAALDAVRKPLARMVEIKTLKRTAINLLDTYVGAQAGARILGGSIRRGNVERVRAAIWLSDMRGFTARADRMPAADLVELLNRYFDCQVAAIREQGGEVLKFMGDGLLAIFPIDGDAEGEVCAAALRAARAAEQSVAAADWAGLEAPGGVAFGVALHVGDVLYGNVGSTDRLDFTCIGPAVNVAARIEKLSGEIGRTILASAEFARHCQGEIERGTLVPLGAFRFKGVAAEQTVYGEKPL